MAKITNAAKVSGAGKINGTWKYPTVCPFTGGALERPGECFPELKMNGVVVAFFPGWNNNGECVGWSITVSNPIADALAAVDDALAATIDDVNTAMLWDDLIPTHRRGKECVLQLCCTAKMIRKFMEFAGRNGFHPFLKKPAKMKGGVK